MRSLSSPISKAGWWSLCSPPSAHLRHRSPPWRQEPSMYETRRTGSAEQWSLWWNGNEGDSACRHTHKYQAPINSRLLLLLPASYHKTFSTCTVGVWKGQTVHFYQKLEINSAKRHQCAHDPHMCFSYSLKNVHHTSWCLTHRWHIKWAATFFHCVYLHELSARRITILAKFVRDWV